MRPTASTFIRIWKRQNGHYRSAYIEVSKGTGMDRVVAATPALGFMIGWRFSKVIERTDQFGFHRSTVMNFRKSGSWINKKPKKTNEKS